MNKFGINSMKNSRKSIFKVALATLLFALCSATADAQTMKQKRFSGDYKWKVSLQMNMMDSSFDTDKPFNTENWSSMAFPSKITVERHLVDHLGFELGYSMNTIEKGKMVNKLEANDDLNTFGIDGNFKYSLGGLFNIPIVDPYLETGMGYHELDGESKTTFNFGGGLNIWLADFGFMKNSHFTQDKLASRFGLNLEAVGKKNISGGPGSHMQLSAGIFFVY